jgi:SAM-dependent methyltransferase
MRKKRPIGRGRQGRQKPKAPAKRAVDDREIAIGKVNFGDLHRFVPLSWNYGFSRGTPIDRYYIEGFLSQHKRDVRGAVLEVEDNSYTQCFGENRVRTSDVLHVTPGHPGATIIGDLTDAPGIAANSYDCVILTQTLQYIYDTRAALATIHRILRPGGVVLATFPGLSRTSDPLWSDRWYWNFTSRSARRLFEEVFEPESVTVQSFGNLFIATAFLYGLALSEVATTDLEWHDEGFEITIAVRAKKTGR